MIDVSQAPSWVPAIVVEIAPFLPVHCTRDGEDIGARLLTDARMKGVWKALRDACDDIDQDSDVGRESPTLKAILAFDDRYKPQHWNEEFSQRSGTAKDTVCAIFYSYAVTNLSMDRPVVTRAFLKQVVKPYREAAALCRQEAEFGIQAKVDADVQKAMMIVARHFEDHATFIAQADNPMILDRSSAARNDDRQRVRVMTLAACTLALVDAVLAGSLAAVTEIALGLPRDSIKEKTAREWCLSLRATN